MFREKLFLFFFKYKSNIFLESAAELWENIHNFSSADPENNPYFINQIAGLQLNPDLIEDLDDNLPSTLKGDSHDVMK